MYYLTFLSHILCAIVKKPKIIQYIENKSGVKLHRYHTVLYYNRLYAKAIHIIYCQAKAVNNICFNSKIRANVSLNKAMQSNKFHSPDIKNPQRTQLQTHPI